MPIYEYHCEPCDHDFETLIRHQGDVAHCPKCGNVELSKLFSVPAAAKTSNGQGSALPVCDTGPSRLGGCGGGACMSGMCGMD